VLTRILILLSLLAGAPRLFAQATPTASRAGDLIIGGGYTSAVSDYGHRFTGFAIYGDFDFTRHLGVEANFHKVSYGAGSPLYEKTYEIGPRFFLTYGRFVPYAKIMIGRGVFNYPALPPPAPQDQARANLAYNMYAGALAPTSRFSHGCMFAAMSSSRSGAASPRTASRRSSTPSAPPTTSDSPKYKCHAM